MKRIHIVPYKMGSKSAKELKESLVELGYKTYRTLSSKLVPKNKTLVLYYGGSELLPEGGIQLNRNRTIAQNKLFSFRAFDHHKICCVPWTTDKNVAKDWDLTVVRHLLSGHSGAGIELIEKATELPAAPLYTKYIKKQMECRIHVFNGKVIDAQIKRKKLDLPENTEVNTKIRNIHTGWVYCREGFVPADAAKELAINAVKALELDFGAVDLLYNQREDKYYVLEVNTAPGLEGTTLNNYIKEILNVYNLN